MVVFTLRSNNREPMPRSTPRHVYVRTEPAINPERRNSEFLREVDTPEMNPSAIGIRSREHEVRLNKAAPKKITGKIRGEESFIALMIKF